jgi:hypothetical protein
MSGVEDLLVGSARANTNAGLVESSFEKLLEDRPHLIWRAILDTEVFRLQTPEQCIKRLGLAVTDARDTPFIYKGLSGFHLPHKIHIDDSEIVSGVLPLPVAGNTASLAASAGRKLSRAEEGVVHSLNWVGSCMIGGNWEAADNAAAIPAWAQIKPVDGRKAACHVAIVASCQGEAVLLTKWIRTRIAELETLVHASVVSFSWLATDVAPVGHLVDDSLRAIPVEAQVWVLASLSARFVNCSTTSMLQKSLGANGDVYFELALDQQEGNLRQKLPDSQKGVHDTVESESVVALPISGVRGLQWVGGLFREELLATVAFAATNRSTR